MSFPTLEFRIWILPPESESIQHSYQPPMPISLAPPSSLEDLFWFQLRRISSTPYGLNVHPDRKTQFSTSMRNTLANHPARRSKHLDKNWQRRNIRPSWSTCWMKSHGSSTYVVRISTITLVPHPITSIRLSLTFTPSLLRVRRCHH